MLHTPVRQQCFDFGGEDKITGQLSIVQGLDPIAVAGEEEAPVPAVVQGDGPKAVEAAL
jgi:hypothetical protein